MKNIRLWTGLLLAVALGGAWYVRDNTAASTAVATPASLERVESVPAASKSIQPPAPKQPTAESVARPASATSPGGLLSRPPLDWFRQALSPTASVRDRIMATHIFQLCLQAKGADDDLAKQATRSADAMPASAPGVSAAEWQGLRKLVGVSPERVREIRQIQAYCGNAADFDYPAKVRQLSTRPTEFTDLITVMQPASRRIPLLTTVLSSPQAHDLEVRLWAENDLREILESREGLAMLQSWHAEGWLLQQVLGDSEQVHLYWQLRCAWLGFCRSAGLLSEEDRQRAEAAAARVLVDLQRQDWPRLIYSPRR